MKQLITIDQLNINWSTGINKNKITAQVEEIYNTVENICNITDVADVLRLVHVGTDKKAYIVVGEDNVERLIIKVYQWSDIIIELVCSIKYEEEEFEDI